MSRDINPPFSEHQLEESSDSTHLPRNSGPLKAQNMNKDAAFLENNTNVSRVFSFPRSEASKYGMLEAQKAFKDPKKLIYISAYI